MHTSRQFLTPLLLLYIGMRLPLSFRRPSSAPEAAQLGLVDALCTRLSVVRRAAFCLHVLLVYFGA
jgi:hypothetical protein